jgi:hypothetical protein
MATATTRQTGHSTQRRRDRVDRAVDTSRHNPWLTGIARVGLASRAVLYLVLAGLAVRIAFTGGHPARHGSRQADPGGALRLVAAQPLGRLALAVAAAGFALFAVTRYVAAAAAARDKTVWPATRAAGEATAYAAIAVATTFFLLGRTETGTQREHVTFTAHLLSAPAGRALVVALGAAIVVGYVGLAVFGLTRGFEQRLDEGRMPRPLVAVARVTGAAGYTGRAVAFVPVGAFLIVAAVTYQPSQAKGLDVVLADAARHWWGLLLLAAVALGFVAFAAYSMLEAAYRKVGNA